MTKDHNLTSIESIHAFLRALPPVKQGFQRVLRGQRRLYDSLLPAGLRGTHPRKHLFKVAVKSIADELKQRPGDDVADFFVWTEAIAQHYGPGSPYLDVTTSLDVALWFALHQLENVKIQQLMGPLGPYNPLRDLWFDFEAYSPSPPGDAPGYLMVLDVPKSDNIRQRDHGTIIDLQNLPIELSDSTRILNQQASLVWADSKVDGGNLAQFLVQEPVRIAAVVRDQITASVDLTHLFPGPQDDPWYRRLLSIPLTLELDTITEALRLSQTIPVTVYGHDPSSFAEVTDAIITVDPPILVDLLRTELQRNRPAKLVGFLPDDAITILVEEPLFLITPRIDSDQWFDSEAATNLPDTAQVRASQSQPESLVPLRKVYFEFSPLELGGWESIESSSTGTIVFHCGAYLEQSEDEFILWRVVRHLPGGGQRVHSPIRFVLDDRSGRFFIRTSDGQMTDARETAPLQLKTLLVTLTILRDLSATSIPNTYAAIATDSFFVLPLVGHRELVRATFRTTEIYLIRNPGNDDIPRRTLSQHGLEIVARNPPSAQHPTERASKD